VTYFERESWFCNPFHPKPTKYEQLSTLLLGNLAPLVAFLGDTELNTLALGKPSYGRARSARRSVMDSLWLISSAKPI